MVQLANSVSPTTTTTSTLTGVSPIGTSSPNTGSTAATNSTYGQGAFTSGVANQGTGTAYTVQNTDYQGIVKFDTASAVTVTLNQAVSTNFTCSIMNVAAGPITLTPNGGLLVNGVTSLTLAAGQNVQVLFANRLWTAFIGSTIIPTTPPGTLGVGVDGGGAAPATGVKGQLVVPYNCTIDGWTVIADVGGSMSMDVCFHAGAAPPTAPPIPNTTTDKISASAPIVLSGAQSSAGGAAAISTWSTSLTEWGTLMFNLTSVTTCTKLMVQVFVTKA